MLEQQGAPIVSGREVLPNGSGGQPPVVSGIEQSTGGGQISGRWFNKRTGQVVIVRDFIQDGEMPIISTSIGMIDADTFSRDYIQASDEMYDENGTVIGTEQVTTKDIVAKETKSTMQAPPTPRPEFEKPARNEISKPKIKNSDLIGKVLAGNLPTLTVDVDWMDIPDDGIQALTKYFNVSFDDIVKYILNNVKIDEDHLKKVIIKKFFPEMGAQ